MLSHVLDNKTLRSICYAIFESHFWYASLVWAKITYSIIFKTWILTADWELTSPIHLFFISLMHLWLILNEISYFLGAIDLIVLDHTILWVSHVGALSWDKNKPLFYMPLLVWTFTTEETDRTDKNNTNT